MRIIIKIILSFVMIVVGTILNAVVSETGNSTTGFVRLIPAAVMIIGIIAIWRYKPEKRNSNKDLDKKL